MVKPTQTELDEIQAKRIAEQRKALAKEMANNLQDQIRRLVNRIELTTGVKVVSVTVDCRDNYVAVVKLDSDE